MSQTLHYETKYYMDVINIECPISLDKMSLVGLQDYLYSVHSYSKQVLPKLKLDYRVPPFCVHSYSKQILPKLKLEYRLPLSVSIAIANKSSLN